MDILILIAAFVVSPINDRFYSMKLIDIGRKSIGNKSLSWFDIFKSQFCCARCQDPNKIALIEGI